MQIVMTVEERMLSKINYNGILKPYMATRCHEWTDKLVKGGYGQLRVGEKKPKAHRLAYQLWVGPIPPDKPQVLHHCDNPPCVNPEHLFAGTVKDNMCDMVAKGRCYQSKKTHCPKGHEYNSINTRINKDSGKTCRVCDRQRKKEISA